MNIISLSAILFTLFILVSPSWAAKHALLIGVSNYHVKPLSGPINDVMAMQKVLINKWNFRDKDIELILNEQGTRKNILQAMSNLYDKSKPGDDIFIYMSGHGTSSNDNALSIPLPTTSGAFIPIDISEAKKIDDLISKLIIGKRDLQPIFSTLDKGGRNLFVVIDACYSGNTVRGKYSDNTLQTRVLSLSELLPNRAFGDDLDLERHEDWTDSNTNEIASFPYKSVYYLSAAGEHEPAQDIPPNMLDIYPTIDGKPHGAFTDTLLRILNKEIDPDIDQNGLVSYGELKTTVRSLMRIRGFDHTPQGLPSLAEDKGNLSKRSLFGEAESILNLTENTTLAAKSTRMPITATTAELPKFTIKVDQSINSMLREAISNIANISLADAIPDLMIKKQQGDYLFISKSGDLITKLSEADNKEVIALIKTQQKLNDFLQHDFIQSFSLELDMYGIGKGSTAVQDENIGFTIKSDKDSYVLLFNIDSHGMVSILYPYFTREPFGIKSNDPLKLKSISKVRPPFGRDIIIAAAFSEMTESLKAMKGKSFSIHSPEFNKLEKLIFRSKNNQAKAQLVLITAKK